MSSRRQTLLARVNWYLQSSLKHITELITGNKPYYRGGRYKQVSLYQIVCQCTTRPRMMHDKAHYYLPMCQNRRRKVTINITEYASWLTIDLILFKVWVTEKNKTYQNSMSVNKDVLAWLHIGWCLCCKPIRSQGWQMFWPTWILARTFRSNSGSRSRRYRSRSFSSMIQNNLS